MTVSAPKRYSTLQRWKERIMLDIGARGLKPGDAYLTVEETGVLLGCSRATAHRAMKKLIEEGVLVARPGSGTFIGDEARGAASNVPQALHVLMPRGFGTATTVPFMRLVQAVAQSFGGLGVQFNSPPEGYDLNYISETVLKPFREGQIKAVLAVSCQWKAYQYLKEQGITALVCGSMFQNRQFLPSLDKDAAKGAELLVDYLVKNHHRRMGVIMPASGLAGVDFFTDAVSRSLAKRGISADALTLRYCTGDESVTIDRIRDLLSAPNRPTALITDEADLADLARNAAESLGLSVPRDVEIVFEGSVFRTDYPARYPHTRVTLPESELAAEISDMIKGLNTLNGVAEPKFLPVQLATAKY